MDRHVPCRAPPDADWHARVSHRQRGRDGGGGQPPTPGGESRARRATGPRRALPHGQALARILFFLCGARRAARVPGDGRARRRQERRRPAVRRARVAAARRSFANAFRGWCSAAGRTRTRPPSAQVDYLRDPRFTAEFYLTQIVSHHNLAPVERFLDAADGRRRRARACSACSITAARTPRTLASARAVPARSGRGVVAGVRSWRHAARPCARGRFARCSGSACGTSTSATCRLAVRARPSRRSSSWRPPRSGNARQHHDVGQGSSCATGCGAGLQPCSYRTSAGLKTCATCEAQGLVLRDPMWSEALVTRDVERGFSPARVA